jgi:hypothetical protein
MFSPFMLRRSEEKGGPNPATVPHHKTSWLMFKKRKRSGLKGI